MKEYKEQPIIKSLYVYEYFMLYINSCNSCIIDTKYGTGWETLIFLWPDAL